MHVRSNGINAIGIEQGDELVAARITDGNQIVFLASHEGMAVRFDESHVRPMGRAAFGVWGIDLDEKDYVVGMATTTKPGAESAAQKCGDGRLGRPGRASARVPSPKPSTQPSKAT